MGQVVELHPRTETRKITGEELALAVWRIKPLLLKNGELHYLTVHDPWRDLFLGNQQFAEPALDIEKFREIATQHPWDDSPMLFKPTVAQVVEQIPVHLVDQVVAFEMVQTPSNIGDPQCRVVGSGYHNAQVMLYRTKG